MLVLAVDELRILLVLLLFLVLLCVFFLFLKLIDLDAFLFLFIRLLRIDFELASQLLQNVIVLHLQGRLPLLLLVFVERELRVAILLVTCGLLVGCLLVENLVNAFLQVLFLGLLEELLVA